MSFFNIFNNTIIFILSPYFNTGGPKSLHQLAKSINEQHIAKAMIYYTDGEDHSEAMFDKSIPVAREIDDNRNNIIIVPELYTEWLYKYKHIQKCIWWLSLDYYTNRLIGQRALYEIQMRGLKENIITQTYFKLYLLIRDKFKYRKKFVMSSVHDLKRIIHLYNCEYVRLYLENCGISMENCHYLCGPITNEHMENIEDKSDIVAYNPKKTDLDYLKRVMDQTKQKNHNIEFIPIQGMTADEVGVLLRRAKVYLDLGSFPGPERMPREAVLAKCCIVTSKLGSAGNDIDVPISKDNKFTLTEENIINISNRIIYLLDNYNCSAKDNEQYINKVMNQRERFQSDIRDIFEVTICE